MPLFTQLFHVLNLFAQLFTQLFNILHHYAQLFHTVWVPVCDGIRDGIAACLDGLEYVLRFVLRPRMVLSKFTLVAVSTVSGALSFVCLMKNDKTFESATERGVGAAIVLFYLALSGFLHPLISRLITEMISEETVQAYVERFETLLWVSKCLLTLVVSASMAALSKFVEIVFVWNGYGVGFNFSILCHLISIFKIYGVSDMLGAADAVLNGTIALLAAYYKDDNLGEGDWHYKAVFCVNFVLLLFKNKPATEVAQTDATEGAQPGVSELELPVVRASEEDEIV
ncbi:unnamed protein product [Brassica napus]|uniref:(rape) hypothetical protein n=1 Tax=Brassica napus TaxID=3708 RepID=A0A816JJ70_BRANA|nr:unnamed protein product [Brassica napus]